MKNVTRGKELYAIKVWRDENMCYEGEEVRGGNTCDIPSEVGGKNLLLEVRRWNNWLDWVKYMLLLGRSMKYMIKRLRRRKKCYMVHQEVKNCVMLGRNVHIIEWVKGKLCYVRKKCTSFMASGGENTLLKVWYGKLYVPKSIIVWKYLFF